jgi:preprotein translocase subunit Sss1
MEPEEDSLAARLQRHREGKEQLAAYKQQLAAYEESRKLAAEDRKYSEQEFDKLVIYLAGGGLVLTIGFVKDLIKITEATNITLLILCWAGFISSLLMNLISHRLAVWARDAFLSDLPVWRQRDRYTRWANLLCLVLITLGVLFFVFFVVQNLPAHVKG